MPGCVARHRLVVARNARAWTGALGARAQFRRAVARACARLFDRRKTSNSRRAGTDTCSGPHGARRSSSSRCGIAVWLLGLLLHLRYAGFVLRQFPYTRPWGKAAGEPVRRRSARFASRILHAIPGLLFVALIFVLARSSARVVRGVLRGRSEWARPGGLGGRDHGTADRANVICVVWLFALVAAYPYIPGSESEAFKGVGVFVGLMLSIGASGIVNQAVSGLMLMYTRSLRPGEFVQIGDTEGTVRSVGFLTTRIETLRQRGGQHPERGDRRQRDAQLLAARRPTAGVRIREVTIGYDTPWRQVHAMLLRRRRAPAGRPGAAAARAADRPPGLLRRIHAAGRHHGSVAHASWC